MSNEPVITREIMPLPARRDEVHKGDVGRMVIIGGSIDEVVMAGAPALAANAAFRSGTGLVQLFVPEALRPYVAVISPCATVRTLPREAEALHQAVQQFQADVVVLGPGLGTSLDPDVILDFLSRYDGHVVIDADGLNQLARIPSVVVPHPDRTVLTPHPGELKRLIASHNLTPPSGDKATARRYAALLLHRAVGGVVVLKGQGTIVTDGARMYINETGNSGMATGGMGDVLTGIIAALIGQNMPPMEASILGVFLHGLAGDFAAEELGRYSMTALDVLEYLPEAFREHETAEAE
jgi:ADP-dependent NAD(P)H-hydrate dehydratase